MKHTLIDINELSDSKEVYGQRPNPFISYFIYALFALIVVALIYSFVGKIEVVATTSGIVRPNDDVSTVSSLVGGRITSVNYADGQIVQKGDSLLTVDTSELQISLKSLKNTQSDYETQYVMLDKFLNGIEAGKNPFSSNPESEEYAYFVQYRDYELSQKNTQDTIEYDAKNAEANIASINKQISEIEKQLDGLNAYKNSVQQGSNKASSYPEYENMYLLYVSSVEDLGAEYQAQREQVELDPTSANNQYYLTYYNDLITDYSYLVDSIKNEQSAFPAEYSGAGLLLWNDYSAELEEYKRGYESAVENYNYYLNGGSSGGSKDELLAYDRTMLEGYQYYKQSVENDTDMFVEENDSVYYRNLYTEYKAKYDELKNDVDLANEQYISILNDPTSTEANINDALEAKNSAEESCSSFRANTLAAIGNTILQIEASIAEKEIGIGSTDLDYNTSMAKSQMESAEAAISTYKNKMLAEYQKAISDYKTKIQEIQLNTTGEKDKETLLAELEESYQNALEQKYYQTIGQIDTNINTLQSELSSNQANLRLYQITSNMYQANRDENGVPITISLSTMEQISALLSRQETLSDQLNDLDTQIKQTEEQIAQGTILAEQSGTVSVINTLVKGDMITAGTSFATIIPLNESEFKVQLYVSNSDIANIEIGDEIKYNLAALPSNQYGMVSGTVINISTDTLVQDGQYSGFYLVEGSIEKAELTDSDGNSGSVAIGMQVEAKIVTQKKTIIRYLLEKIDLF